MQAITKNTLPAAVVRAEALRAAAAKEATRAGWNNSELNDALAAPDPRTISDFADGVAGAWRSILYCAWKVLLAAGNAPGAARADALYHALGPLDGYPMTANR